jgi:hypothetical protein
VANRATEPPDECVRSRRQVSISVKVPFLDEQRVGSDDGGFQNRHPSRAHVTPLASRRPFRHPSLPHVASVHIADPLDLLVAGRGVVPLVVVGGEPFGSEIGVCRPHRVAEVGGTCALANANQAVS